MPVFWYTQPWAVTHAPSGPGRPHRDRKKINAGRKAARRNRGK